MRKISLYVNVSDINTFTAPPSVLSEQRITNRRNYRDAVVATVSLVVVLSFVTHIPLAMPAVTPYAEVTAYFGTADAPVSSSPNFLIYYFGYGDTALQAMEQAFEDVSLSYILSYFGVTLPGWGWLLDQVNEYAGAYISGEDGATLTDIIANWIIDDIGDALPWWLDWCLPALVGEAFVIAGL